MKTASQIIKENDIIIGQIASSLLADLRSKISDHVYSMELDLHNNESDVESLRVDKTLSAIKREITKRISLLMGR